VSTPQAEFVVHGILTWFSATFRCTTKVYSSYSIRVCVLLNSIPVLGASATSSGIRWAFFFVVSPDS